MRIKHVCMLTRRMQTISYDLNARQADNNSQRYEKRQTKIKSERKGDIQRHNFVWNRQRIEELHTQNWIFIWYCDDWRHFTGKKNISWVGCDCRLLTFSPTPAYAFNLHSCIFGIQQRAHHAQKTFPQVIKIWKFIIKFIMDVCVCLCETQTHYAKCVSAWSVAESKAHTRNNTVAWNEKRQIDYKWSYTHHMYDWTMRKYRRIVSRDDVRIKQATQHRPVWNCCLLSVSLYLSRADVTVLGIPKGAQTVRIHFYSFRPWSIWWYCLPH